MEVNSSLYITLKSWADDTIMFSVDPNKFPQFDPFFTKILFHIELLLNVVCGVIVVFLYGFIYKYATLHPNFLFLIGIFGLYSEILNIFQAINVFSVIFFEYDKVLSFIYECISIFGGFGFTFLSAPMLIERATAYHYSDVYDNSKFKFRYIYFSIICFFMGIFVTLNFSAQFVHYVFSLLIWVSITLFSTIGLIILYIKNKDSLKKEKAQKKNINKRFQLNELKESTSILVFMNAPLAVTSLGTFLVLMFVQLNSTHAGFASSLVFMNASILSVIFPLVMIFNLTSTKRIVWRMFGKNLNKHAAAQTNNFQGQDKHLNETEVYFSQYTWT